VKTTCTKDVIYIRKPGAWFPWKSLSVLLLIATAAMINLDVKKNGSFRSVLPRAGENL
jgi:hypothetical protein